MRINLLWVSTELSEVILQKYKGSTLVKEAGIQVTGRYVRARELQVARQDREPHGIYQHLRSQRC